MVQIASEKTLENSLQEKRVKKLYTTITSLLSAELLSTTRVSVAGVDRLKRSSLYISRCHGDDTR
jgi:hypothetical protein